LPQLITEVLDANASIDWGQYDNDGLDNKPNSGDDNGIVDFVAFVHPGIGGECNVEGNRNIWSHRSSLARWGKARYATKSKRHGGGTIAVSDYVIMPSLACDGKTMIQIGVFAHEFGHAFGLPDLYDTSGNFQGAGNWCLMSTGSWGGNGNSPEKPSHMSAWAKSMLGWLSPALVSQNLVKQTIAPIVSHPVAYKIPIDADQYYLLENRQRLKNDALQPGSGLMIWKINDRVISLKEATNQINADATNKGVAPIEAGGHELDRSYNSGGNRGDANDPFPGSKTVRRFDRTTTPAAAAHAICDITEAGGNVTLSIKLNAASCTAGPGTMTPAQPGSQTSQPSPPQPAPQRPPTPGLLEKIAANPGAFLGQTVTLDGAVENIGKNYFRDLRLVLRGAAGAELPVGRTPLPLEVPPGRLESTGGPTTLSAVLGKPAIVVGVIRRDPNDPERFILDISDVKVKQ
jgi:M6 family metalloprotease-like protein